MFAGIETYIPHRDRMRLVEELLEADDAHAVTAATVGPDWPLGEDGLLNPLIFIELIAQTTAAGATWKNMHGEGKGEIMTGYLVGVRRASFGAAGVPPGARLVTSSRSVLEVEDYAVFEGEVRRGEDVVATAELQLFHSKLGINEFTGQRGKGDE